MSIPQATSAPQGVDVRGKVILTINAGSSGIKFAAFAQGTEDLSPRLERLLHGEVKRDGERVQLAAWLHGGTPLPEHSLPLVVDSPLAADAIWSPLFEWLDKNVLGGRVTAVAHRVVHGGQRFTAPVRITPEILAQLEALNPLAPLHQPHNLAAIHAIARIHPGLPQIACFDTAFHASQPWVMRACALPRRITDTGVRGYGFHGLSYEYIAGTLPAHLGAQAEGKVVVAHLGSGASLCALAGRRSVATTMGFSALDGLVMGTRCGSLDPGVVLYLMGEMKMEVHQVETLLYTQSGLLGVSGVSSDMRTLEKSTDPYAAEAIDLFVNRLARELGGLAAMLGGLDALVFTAGIGEHSAFIRQRVCESAAWLGLALDADANQAGANCISQASSRVSAWVIPTNEELMLAEHALQLLAPPSQTPPGGKIP